MDVLFNGTGEVPAEFGVIYSDGGIKDPIKNILGLETKAMYFPTKIVDVDYRLREIIGSDRVSVAIDPDSGRSIAFAGDFGSKSMLTTEALRNAGETSGTVNPLVPRVRGYDSMPEQVRGRVMSTWVRELDAFRLKDPVVQEIMQTFAVEQSFGVKRDLRPFSRAILGLAYRQYRGALTVLAKERLSELKNDFAEKWAGVQPDGKLVNMHSGTVMAIAGGLTGGTGILLGAIENIPAVVEQAQEEIASVISSGIASHIEDEMGLDHMQIFDRIIDSSQRVSPGMSRSTEMAGLDQMMERLSDRDMDELVSNNKIQMAKRYGSDTARQLEHLASRIAGGDIDLDDPDAVSRSQMELANIMAGKDYDSAKSILLGLPLLGIAALGSGKDKVKTRAVITALMLLGAGHLAACVGAPSDVVATPAPTLSAEQLGTSEAQTNEILEQQATQVAPSERSGVEGGAEYVGGERILFYLKENLSILNIPDTTMDEIEKLDLWSDRDEIVKLLGESIGGLDDPDKLAVARFSALIQSFNDFVETNGLPDNMDPFWGIEIDAAVDVFASNEDQVYRLIPIIVTGDNGQTGLGFIWAPLVPKEMPGLLSSALGTEGQDNKIYFVQETDVDGNPIEGQWLYWPQGYGVDNPSVKVDARPLGPTDFLIDYETSVESINPELIVSYQPLTDLKKVEGIVVFREGDKYAPNLDGSGNTKEIVDLVSGESYAWSDLVSRIESGSVDGLPADLVEYARLWMEGRQVVDFYSSIPGFPDIGNINFQNIVKGIDAPEYEDGLMTPKKDVRTQEIQGMEIRFGQNVLFELRINDDGTTEWVKTEDGENYEWVVAYRKLATEYNDHLDEVWKNADIDFNLVDPVYGERRNDGNLMQYVMSVHIEDAFINGEFSAFYIGNGEVVWYWAGGEIGGERTFEYLLSWLGETHNLADKLVPGQRYRFFTETSQSIAVNQMGSEENPYVLAGIRSTHPFGYRLAVLAYFIDHMSDGTIGLISAYAEKN